MNKSNKHFFYWSLVIILKLFHCTGTKLIVFQGMKYKQANLADHDSLDSRKTINTIVISKPF